MTFGGIRVHRLLFWCAVALLLLTPVFAFEYALHGAALFRGLSGAAGALGVFAGIASWATRLPKRQAAHDEDEWMNAIR